ncbi:MAG: phosphonoacetaldehyde reductase [Clostridiales bacterium]|nr:phosphonoacetaldehyde reductase [Clostridiales bacterium]
MAQNIVSGLNSHKNIERVLNACGSKKPMLVCDGSFEFLNIKSYFEQSNFPYVRFDKFTSNPLYDDVCNGVDLFRSEHCDCIIAVGGGSAMDVAKCIKLFSGMDRAVNYLEQEKAETGVPLIAVPTTAGTGSESTRFAVIYYNGKKQSVAHQSIIPNHVILDWSVLSTLPVYQKKCTMLDALCQGIESWWSVNSTDESKGYAQNAVCAIVENYKDYIFENKNGAAEKIMVAANFAGRAINISQTTAPHAMSYKLTSLYGIPHGHAVAVCLPKVWRFMTEHTDKCIDNRGKDYLLGVFEGIAKALGAVDIQSAITRFEGILAELEISAPKSNVNDLGVLASSVNPVRLVNNPVRLDEADLTELYKQILNL